LGLSLLTKKGEQEMSKVYLRGVDGQIFWTENPQYHKEAERLTKKEGERLYLEQCKAKLRDMLPPKSRVYVVLRHVSQSGMQRKLSLHHVWKAGQLGVEGTISDITYLASVVLGWKLDGKTGHLVVNGCGMDMGFHTVYSLGASLWPEGTPEPHGTRNGEPDSAGGYSLKHEWL
jgi:hypothetical protein